MAEQKITQTTFSISEAIRFGWEIAKKNLWFFVAMLLVTETIGLVTSFIYQPMIKSNDILVILLGIILFIISGIIKLEISFAQLSIYFKFADKKKASIKDLFVYFDTKLLFRYFLINFLLILIIFVGLLLFIVPGIYLGLKYWFVPYIYVDKRTGIIESFKESAKLSQGIKKQLFFLGLLQILIQIGGLLALLVGLFIAIPINYLSDIYVYRKLSKTIK